MSDKSDPKIQDLVLKDTQQRAFEIHLRSIKQYQIQKKKILIQRMDEVSTQTQKRFKQQLIQKKIHKSSIINHARMNKMILRNDLVMNLVSSAQHQIYEMITRDKAKYKSLLRDLIVKSLIDLFQQKVLVRCLKRDAALVQEVIPDCVVLYREWWKELFGFEVDLELTLNTEQYLIERKINEARPVTTQTVVNDKQKSKKMTEEQLIQKAEQDLKCFGGVLLTTEDKLITSKNTLDARIELTYSKLLPQIREHLFS